MSYTVRTCMYSRTLSFMFLWGPPKNGVKSGTWFSQELWACGQDPSKKVHEIVENSKVLGQKIKKTVSVHVHNFTSFICRVTVQCKTHVALFLKYRLPRDQIMIMALIKCPLFHVLIFMLFSVNLISVFDSSLYYIMHYK